MNYLEQLNEAFPMAHIRVSQVEKGKLYTVSSEESLTLKQKQLLSHSELIDSIPTEKGIQIQIQKLK